MHSKRYLLLLSISTPTRYIRSQHTSAMLVISTKFLIGVFVAFYASVASATPTAVTEDTTELLEARAPVDNKCGQMTWVRRECAPGRSGMAWDDVCENNHYNVKVAGLCPDNTVCEDTLEIDRPNNRVLEIIICVPIAPVGTAQPRKRAEDPQIGSSSKKQATNRYGVTQMHHEVFIADDMTASISAVILSEFLLYINIVIGAYGYIMRRRRQSSRRETRQRYCWQASRQRDYSLHRGYFRWVEVYGVPSDWTI